MTERTRLSARTLLNLALLLLVAALATFVALHPAKKKAPPPRLTSFAPDQIKDIRIERQGHITITLKKQTGGHWRILAPIDTPANDFRIDNLLRLARARSYARYPVAGLALAKFGLQAPALKVFFNAQEIDFGGTEPLNHRRYVKVGDAVHLISSRYYHMLNAALPSYVSLNLLPPGSRITALHLPQLTLLHQGTARWTLTPHMPGVSADAIHSLVQAWQNAGALWVQRYKKTSKTPLDHVTLDLQGEKQPLRFEIVTRKSELVMARPDIGMEYHLPRNAAQHLLKLPQTPQPAPALTKRSLTK